MHLKAVFQETKTGDEVSLLSFVVQVSTPCASCMVAQPYQNALLRELVFHFDVVSILAGHDRGIICKYEREQRSAKIRADKLLLLGEGRCEVTSSIPKFANS